MVDEHQVRDLAGNYVIVPVETAETDFVTVEELQAALEAFEFPEPVIEQFVTNIATHETFITELVTNETYITELTEEQTFIEQTVNQITAVEENNTYVEQITNNQTFVTQVFEQTTVHLNGKKGVANELATLDGSGYVPLTQLSPTMKTAVIPFILDGNGAEITDGFKGFIVVPFACTITGWFLLSEQSGAIKIDIWKDTYASFPPTNADSITNGTEPEITASGVKAQDLAVTDWVGEALAAGDILGFNVDSCTSIQKVTLALFVTR